MPDVLAPRQNPERSRSFVISQQQKELKMWTTDDFLGQGRSWALNYGKYREHTWKIGEKMETYKILVFPQWAKGHPLISREMIYTNGGFSWIFHIYVGFYWRIVQLQQMCFLSDNHGLFISRNWCHHSSTTKKPCCFTPRLKSFLSRIKNRHIWITGYIYILYTYVHTKMCIYIYIYIYNIHMGAINIP